jgi:hypothetical protein
VILEHLCLPLALSLAVRGLHFGKACLQLRTEAQYLYDRSTSRGLHTVSQSVAARGKESVHLEDDVITEDDLLSLLDNLGAQAMGNVGHAARVAGRQMGLQSIPGSLVVVLHTAARK